MSYYGKVPEFADVLYKEGDFIGFCLAVASLFPPAFLIIHMAIFFCRREAQDLWFAIGQFVCEGSNQVIKHILKQDRPISPVLNMPLDSYGMPSAHSQFMGYLIGYTLYQVLDFTKSPLHERATHFISVFVLSILVGVSRWYLWYHTADQVLAGLFFGFVLGVFWYAISKPLRKWGVVSWLLTLWPCKLFKVKDTDYDVTSEYEQWLQQTQKKIE